MNVQCSTPAALNSSNYDTGVSVTVSGAIDNVDDSDVTCLVSASNISGDTVYAALPTTAVGTVDVTVTNDDTASFALSTSTLTVNDSTGSNTANFIVTLGSQPANPVNLTFASTGECTVSTPAALNSSNYDTGVTVTVTGVVDSIDDTDATCVISASSITGDATYAALPTTDVGTVTVTVVDDDNAGFTLSTNTLTVDDSTGSNTASFIVTLDSEPTSAVNLTFASTGECTVSTPSSAQQRQLRHRGHGYCNRSY